MAASTPAPLSKKSQEAFIEYYNQIIRNTSQFRSNLRHKLLEVDKAYQREMDLSIEQQRAKLANKAGDSDRFQNITVPVVMPQVEAAVTYQTSVFLTGTPLFGCVAKPSFMDEATQMETVIDDEATKGGWQRQFILAFRDAFKYNLMATEVDWHNEVTYSVETNLNESIKEGTPKEVIWSGNKVKRVDLYNIILDHRVPPTEVHTRGEFAGYTERMTRMELKSLIESLPDKIISNIKPALESSSDSSSVSDPDAFQFHTPEVNPVIINGVQESGGFNWASWAGLADRVGNIQYKDVYDVTRLYCRVLPDEFGLQIPKSKTPQIFKLFIVNHQHIIYAERQTNAHNLLPLLVGQPLEDGLGYQTKSLADNGLPFQQVASAYMNSILHSRRRAVTDRVLYDPSRITPAHINSDNPSAKIPVRPAAYGSNISQSVYAFPYREDQGSFSMQQIQQLLGLANMLSGQNLASQGQFVKGNKTLHEFESVMQNANGRDQLAAILLEFQVFTPLKHILKLNILQYQGGTRIYNRDKEVEVEVDPVALRKAVIEFKVSDGLIPSSKLINADTLAIAMQQIGSSPHLAGAYNIGQLFSYFMKTQGAKITEFEKSEEQMAYEQAMQQWQQIAMFAIDKGVPEDKLPPQPLPEQYGYNPSNNKPSPDQQREPAGV